MTDIAASSSVSAASGKSASSLVSFSKNFDSFLMLLTQQLKNQDPLKPMDATQFTTQLVQFTGVEQAIRQNQNLEQMIAQQRDAQIGAAVSYLGKTVDLNGNQVALTGTSTGIAYDLSAGVHKLVLNISDANGTIVRTVDVSDKTQGPHSYTWDGKNNNGVQLPNGTYGVSFSALDATGNPAKDTSGAPVTVKTTTSGVVSNVSVVDGALILTVSGQKIPLTEVLSVRETTI